LQGYQVTLRNGDDSTSAIAPRYAQQEYSFCS
jgi:hypothetical protein